MNKTVCVCLLFLTGCSLLMSTPKVTMKDVSFVSLDSGGLTIEFLLSVTNPNVYDIALLGYSYDLQFMALPLAHGGARKRFDFPGKSTTYVKLPATFGYGDLLELLKQSFPDPDSIPYRLQAGLELDTPVGVVVVPLDNAGSFAIPPEYHPGSFLKQIGKFVNEVTR